MITIARYATEISLAGRPQAHSHYHLDAGAADQEARKAALALAERTGARLQDIQVRRIRTTWTGTADGSRWDIADEDLRTGPASEIPATRGAYAFIVAGSQRRVACPDCGRTVAEATGWALAIEAFADTDRPLDRGPTCANCFPGKDFRKSFSHSRKPYGPKART